MADSEQVLVFVHGWSVTNLNTYGQLPIRLQTEIANLVIKNIYLGEYISFRDEVQLHDISRAFQSAVDDQLADVLGEGKRFICITHSTGGPVIRDWWDYYYSSTGNTCPMSHLIMLAPANFGSALAQLGKGKISRLKSWFESIEPGQGVLNWLELGSDLAWQLNEKWIKSDGTQISEAGIFPFCVIGQSIDRKFYDNLNSYTGELGSDGVVRAAAANLNATYISVKQGEIEFTDGTYSSQPATWNSKQAPPTAFRIVKGKSHSGEDMGIMASPKQNAADDNQDSADLVEVILRCIAVNDLAGYSALMSDFATETATVQAEEYVEKVDGLFSLFERHFIHDKFSMVIFRVYDSEDHPISDYDLVFTGPENNPNYLPVGFFADRQQNSLSPETVTYFVNYDIMNGCDAVDDENGKELRPAQPGISTLGLQIKPHMDSGFVRYMPLTIDTDKTFLENVIKPNATTMIDICLQRIVSKEVFKLVQPEGPMPIDDNFSKTVSPDGDIAKA